MRILFTLLALLSFYLGHSTHLLGGYITYKHVSGTTYEIKLTLYRDCNSATPFDGTNGAASAAIVGVYDANNNFIDIINLYNPVVTVIEGDTTLPCSVPPAVCREVGVYTSTFVLPSANTTYTLVHERCCLPFTVLNIYNPGDQGSVFTATIPANSNNNSPTFNLDLARYIRIYDTTNIVNWCTDIDGDSLVFSLANPLSGASPSEPAPNPPYGGPYPPVTFYPGYNATQPFGAASNCTVNSYFGQIQIVPQGAGIYIMNVLVSEYRNANLLSQYPVLLNITVSDCISASPPVNPGDTISTSIISPNAANNEIYTYPNPASDAVSIKYGGTEQQAYLYDIKGMKLQEVELSNGQAQLKQLSAYAPGIYYIQIGNVTKRLVIARQ